MIHLSILRRVVLLVFLGGVAPTFAAAAPAPDWSRDYTPAQFRELDAAKQPIDPASFQEALLAAAIFQATNQQRIDLKLPAFLPDQRASTAARLHAEWMARTLVLSHDEPSPSGSTTTALERMVQQGIHPSATAENIAYNFLLDLVPGKAFHVRSENGRKVYSYQPGGPPLTGHTYESFARTIVEQWMQSPLHRAHIVSPDLRLLGVGTALCHRQGHPDTIYATQDFFTSAPLPAAGSTPTEATLLPPRP